MYNQSYAAVVKKLEKYRLLHRIFFSTLHELNRHCELIHIFYIIYRMAPTDKIPLKILNCRILQRAFGLKRSICFIVLM